MTPVERPRSARAEEPATVPTSWCHYQVVYHGDQDLLLCRLVDPLVRELEEGGWIDRFYFVRYELGGPHVRLRFRTLAGVAPVEEALAARCRDFFAEHPSASSWPEEKIVRINRQIRGRDPSHGEEDPVFADESWHRAELGLEVRRYGGPETLEDAMDLFWLSSRHVLEQIRSHGRGSAGFNALVVAETLRGAAALAGDDDELLELAGYGREFFGEGFDPCVAEADRLFAARESDLVDLARATLARTRADLSTATSGDDASEDDAVLRRWLHRARRHAAELPLGGDRRHYLLTSHLHMGANRLGLTNPEEVYLSRLARRAAECVLASQSVPVLAPMDETTRRRITA